MKPPTPRNLVKSIFNLAILLLIALYTVAIRADTTDGSTPLALKPGAPAGSYALSGLDNINPYNGSLNFRLPLLNIGGRGSAAYAMTLPIEQKWRINVTPTYLIVYDDGGNGPLPDPQVTYHYFPSSNWWSGIKPGYGPGVLQGRVGQLDSQVCSDSTMRAEMTLTRLTFTAPDGTEFELRDKQTGGAPASVGICDQIGLNRGKVFVTADGSAATFISDQNIIDYIVVPAGGGELFYPSGYLLLRDGTHYRFDNGTVTWLRDRNGNKMTFTYDAFKRATSIKDSINREVTVTYATTSLAYDEIVYKGFGGAARTMRVNYANLQDAGSLRSGYSIQTYYQLFPISGTSLNTNYNPKIVRSVTLPNNQQYQFQYNSYGELARVVLPTGGAFEYDHASAIPGDASGITSGFEGSLNIYRRVIARRVYADGSTLESKQTFSNTESVPCSGCVVVDQFGSDGATRISQRRLFYEGSAVNSFNLGPTDYSPWKDGRENQSEALGSDGTTILQRSANTWQQPIAGSSWPLAQAETNAAAKANSPQITQIVSTLEPSQVNKVSKQIFAYDKYTNKTDVYEYDFGSGTAGALVRRSHTDYLASNYDTLNPSSTNPDLSLTSHIRNLPTQVSVFDGGGVERSRATSEYDNYTLDGSDCQHSFHCPLLLRASISGLDSLFSSGNTMRGNPTGVTRYLLSNGSVTGSISSYSQYDVAGNLVRVLDPRSTLSNNIATTIEYDDRFGAPNNEARLNTAPSELTGFTSFAFPTKVNNALGHTSYAKFDYYLGQPVNGEDANSVIASGAFNDALDRPTQIKRGIGSSVENQTTFAYDDTNRIITTSSDRDAANDNLLVGKVLHDKMGRTIESRQYEGGANFIATQTQYDALGRPFRASNPFRPWQSESAVWTTQAFDSLGRGISVTTADNAVVSTSYSGDNVTVTDQAGKARKSVTDALGRLVQVFEDPTGLNYETSYTYDTLDNLVKVTQGSQQRFFMYDSLKRLLRARNPEQGTHASLSLSDALTGNSAWSIGYQYDVAGNLTQKTDTRGVVSTYVYDGLNRNTTIDYSDTAAINPDVKRFYDGATSGIGRFWYAYKGGDFSNGSNVEHTAIDSYDASGRPLVQRQLSKLNGVWRSTYQTARAYNRVGAVTSQTYPSGHTVAYSYDAAGRASSFTGNLGDGTSRTYSSNISYSSFGGLTREQFGTNTPLYHKALYNIRGQLFDTRLSSVNDTWDWNRGRLLLYYSSNHVWGQSGTDNNANVRFAETWIPPANATLDQTDTLFEESYNYDTLNRLSSVAEQRMSVAGGWGNWQQQFRQQYAYDRYGNRTIDAANTWGTGINNKQFSVDTATNRLGVPNGQSGVMSYDLAGNLINDTYTGAGTREYDAENKMTRAWGGNNQWQEYTYNADGQRVRRKVDGLETWQIYGLDGELLAEYSANAATTNPQKEYGYRNGQLLVTASISTQNVNWTNTVGVSTASNSLTKTTSTGWGNSGAASTQSIVSGDGYVEVTASETNSPRIFGLNDTDVDQSWASIDFGFELDFNGVIYIFESGNNRGTFGTFSTGDKLQVAIIGGVVKYKKNGTVIYTSSVTPTYPLKIDTALYSANCTLNNVVISGNNISGSSATVQWLVADHLGTPRMVVDQTGTLANLKRHDYLPFGEELFTPTGGRSTSLGYATGDGVRQQFTSKERDVETGLDYFLARYFSSTQGRFNSPDPFNIILFKQNSPDGKSSSALAAFIEDPRRWNRFAYSVNSPVVFTDKTGLDIMIVENHATGGSSAASTSESNPFGHTAIAITAHGLYSMGNADRGDRQDNKRNILSGGVMAYIKRESPRRATTLIIIKTTPEQDAAIAKSLEDQAVSQSQLTAGGLVSDNCSLRVNRALDAAGGINMGFAAGLNAPPPSMPGSAGYRALSSGLPAIVIDVPQNALPSEAERSLLEQFERPTSPAQRVNRMPTRTEKKTIGPEDED
jgi:RHS repeat-associated protein